ncbi:MAG: insulinase family protein [Bifidobacteriaceae bacterium]|nr:insulinase family protein [Bifidobacteriaceae bacterium]
MRLVIPAEEADSVKLTVLPSGVRILTKSQPEVRSATIGFWVAVGSRDEAPGGYGSTHFLEHLLFKGTKTRSAWDIAAAFDAVGGEFNASTSKESTCYYARVLGADAPMAIATLADMVTSSVLDPLDFENERAVILEELAMNQDDPVDVAHEAFAGAVYGSHPLGRPIAGRSADIKAVERDQVWDHYQRFYTPSRLIVTVTGAFAAGAVVEGVAEALDLGGWSAASRGTEPAKGRRPTSPAVALPVQGTAQAVGKPTEQAQVLIGCAGLTATDQRRHALSVVATVLGGGMSSRLFQEVREKRGLAYSTYCFASSHSDAGSFGLYAGCSPAASSEVERLLDAEFERLAADGISAEELARAQGQLRGSTLLSLEDPYSAMNRLGRAELLMGELPTVDQMVARINAVTREDVQELAADLAGRARSRVVVGP